MESSKDKLHPRNKHRAPYDFNALCKTTPELSRFILKSKHGHPSINFAQPKAVKALNKALLKSVYNLNWDMTDEFLCPGVPGRADYIHHLADLIGTKPGLKILDIGCGANCIYPLLGHKEYNWQFVGADINQRALDSAQKIIDANHLKNNISLRLQKNPDHIFDGIILNDDAFDAAMCNPPFHSSLKEHKAASERKLRNLKLKSGALNFSGCSNELYCPGGELQFIKTMIKESKHAPITWFTTLVSKKDHIKPLLKELDEASAKSIKIIEMGQGQKTSRLLVWSFKFNP